MSPRFRHWRVQRRSLESLVKTVPTALTGVFLRRYVETAAEQSTPGPSGAGARVTVNGTRKGVAPNWG